MEGGEGKKWEHTGSCGNRDKVLDKKHDKLS